MKPLAFAFFIILVSGCARDGRWSVAAIRDESDSHERRLRVEVIATDRMPWPLHLSVKSHPLAAKASRSGPRRWAMQELAPDRVAFVFAEPVTVPKPVAFDLEISARGYRSLQVHDVLTRF